MLNQLTTTRARIQYDSRSFDASPNPSGRFSCASWRLLEEHITTSYLDPDDPMGLNHIDKTMKTQHVWGSRHIDDAVMMRTDTNDDGTWDHEFYYAADAQFSTLALLDSAGTVHERTRCTPYGEARHSWGNDVDGDGDADSADRSAITSITLGTTIGSAGYRAECDLDRNGKIEVADATKWDNMGGATSALAAGMVSDAKDPYAGSPENAVGYAGYLFNPDEETYSVRFRTYHPDRKRWLQRDPAGYVDGSDTYGYVRGRVTTAIDPMGLGQYTPVASPDTKPFIQGGTKHEATGRINFIPGYTMAQNEMWYSVGGEEWIRNGGPRSGNPSKSLRTVMYVQFMQPMQGGDSLTISVKHWPGSKISLSYLPELEHFQSSYVKQTRWIEGSEDVPSRLEPFDNAYTTPSFRYTCTDEGNVFLDDFPPEGLKLAPYTWKSNNSRYSTALLISHPNGLNSPQINVAMLGVAGRKLREGFNGSFTVGLNFIPTPLSVSFTRNINITKEWWSVNTDLLDIKVNCVCIE